MAYVLSFVIVNDPDVGFVVLGHKTLNPWQGRHAPDDNYNPNSHRVIRRTNNIDDLMNYGSMKDLPIVMIETLPRPPEVGICGRCYSDEICLSVDPDKWVVYANLDEKVVPDWWLNNRAHLEKMVRDKVREVIYGTYVPFEYKQSPNLAPKLSYCYDDYCTMHRLAVPPHIFHMLKLPLHETFIYEKSERDITLYKRHTNQYYRVDEINTQYADLVDPWDLAKQARGKLKCPEKSPSSPPSYEKTVPRPVVNNGSSRVYSGIYSPTTTYTTW